MSRSLGTARRVATSTGFLAGFFFAALSLTAAAGTAIAADPPAPPAPKPAAVRMKFQDFVQDPARLSSLVRAIAVLKSRDTQPTDSVEYRLSWEYWSAIHGYYGPKAKAGLLQAKIDQDPSQKENYKGLRDMEPPAVPAGLASQIWDQCTHSSASGAHLQFLTWHRIYLYYFERILQEAAGDPSLRLPYWDYTNPDQVRLPAEFAEPDLADGRANPLYDARRSSQTVELDPDTTNIDRLLEKTSYSELSGEMEQQPHGTVHCTVGPGCPNAILGDVPVAANDPVFWMHHANIDRMFECWLRRGGTVPEDLLSQDYSFVDTKGSLATMKVGDLFKPDGPIDYTYDNVTHCSREPLPKLATLTETEAKAQLVTEVGKVDAAVPVDDATLTVKLPLTRTGTPGDRLKKSLATTDSPARIELVLGDITFAGPPGVLFKVYLSTTGEKPVRRYVATLSFFTANHLSHGGVGGIPGRVIDVTQDLKALRGTSEELPDLQLELEATPGTAHPDLAAARARFNKKAGLKIGVIRLQVRGGK